MRDQLRSFVAILLLVSCPSCNHSTGQGGNDSYDYMLFVRQGGGDKVFTVNQEPSLNAVSITVIRIQYRDTVVQFLASRDVANATAFGSLDDALHGRTLIDGDFQQPTLPTGTWAHLYMVRADERFEITNTDVRNRLLGFEALVEAKVPQPH